MTTAATEAELRQALARGSMRHEIETIFRYLRDDSEELTREHFDEAIFQLKQLRLRLRTNGT